MEYGGINRELLLLLEKKSSRSLTFFPRFLEAAAFNRGEEHDRREGIKTMVNLITGEFAVPSSSSSSSGGEMRRGTTLPYHLVAIIV